MSTSPDLTAGRPVYVVLEGELELSAAPDVAWGHVMNYPAWQSFHSIEHVSGPVGGEGELVLLHKDEPGAGKSPYGARTVLIEPGKRVIWKIFRDTLREGDATFGIVEFSLRPSAGGSTFRYELFYEFATPDIDEDERELRRQTYVANVGKTTGSIYPKLQKLVEAAA